MDIFAAVMVCWKRNRKDRGAKIVFSIIKAAKLARKKRAQKYRVWTVGIKYGDSRLMSLMARTAEDDE